MKLIVTCPDLLRISVRDDAQKAVVMQISVDGDTSTNDTVIGLASGVAGNAKITDLGSTEAKQLEDAVTALLQASDTLGCHRPAQMFHAYNALCSGKSCQ